MNRRAYLRRSVATVVAAVASFPAALLLGSVLGRGSGTSGTFVAMLLLVPAGLFIAALYWLAISHARARDADLPIQHRIPLYVAPFGAGSAIIALPALLSGSAPAIPMSALETTAWLIELFLPVGFLLMATMYLYSVPSHPADGNRQPFRWPVPALSAYFVACLAPAYAWSIAWFVSFNSYWLKAHATFGMPPILPASLTLLFLGVLLVRDVRSRTLAGADVPA